MAALALSRGLLSSFAQLDKRIQGKVTEIAGVFQRSSPQELRENKGVHLEKYKDQRDPRARTIRITDNHRGIVCDLGDGETFVLHDILPHDEADRWMRRNEFRVNATTGALEIWDLEAVEATLTQTAPEAGGPALFEHRRDKDFTQLGLPTELVPALRAFTSEEQLMGLLGVLPQSQAEALILLTGEEPIETIYAEIAGELEAGAVDEKDLVGALTTPASKSMFTVVADEDDLQEMLARPLAQWRTFLHPSQRSLAERPVFNGPVRVTGGAGTGKTVVAIHRAKFLADHLEDRTGKPILFTTFTKNLAQAIERDLRELGGADLLDCVDVLNVDTLANRLVREHEAAAPSVLQGRYLDDLWQEVADELGTVHRAEFLANEWEQVVLAQGCSSRDDYLKVSRSGRGTRLDRRGRVEVWKAVELMTQKLVDKNARTFLQLADAAAGYLKKHSVRPYRHVIVDEAQDLHESQWRMLRAVVDEGPNDLFIVGDSHQRIYDRRTSLSKVGINIKGRGRRLRINYRTTHEILRWALRLLGEEAYDDLDQGVEMHDFAGYHSFLHGPEPTLEGFSSKRAEYEGLVGRIRTWIEAGVHPEEIAVAGRTAGVFEGLEATLKQAGIPVTHLKGELPKSEGVRLGTMHRLKGIEFRCVAVIDVDDDTVPLPFALTDRFADEVQHRLDLKRERCLLYVACTRARDDLWLGWSGRPSRFFEGLVGS